MARPRAKAILLSAVSLAALAGVGALGAKVTTERSLVAAAARAGATIGKVAANPLNGRITLGDIRLATGAAIITIGQVSTIGGPALIAPAFAAEDVTLENVTVTVGPIRYDMPRMVFTGSSLDRASLAALFAANAPDTLANRLAKISASSVVIPEVKYEFNFSFDGESSQTIGTYTNIAFRDVVNGVAANYTQASATSSTTSRRDKPASPSPGKGDGSTSQPAEPVTEVTTATGTSGSMRIDAFDIAAMTRLYTEGAGAGPNPPVKIHGPYTLANMVITNPNGTKVTIADISGDGFVARLSKIPLMSLMESLQKLPMDEAHKQESSFKILTEALSAWDSIVATSATIKNVKVDLPEPAHSTFTVGDVVVGIGNNPNPQQANPAYPAQGGLRVSMNNAVFALPADAENDFAKRLIAMGYKDLSLSFTIEGRLNEAGKELVINEFSFGGKDMGKAAVSAVIGNVTPDLLSSEEAVRNAAGMALTVKNLAVTVNNAGLADKLLAEEAAKQNKSPDTLKTEYGMIATVGVPSFLGGSPESKALGAAVARFIAKPGQLAVKAAAKDAAGFGLADYGATGGQPAAILEQINLTAEAK
ncbi:hypothetical protein [Chelatococcus asaccharovorans]|uniref:hypothetical protein n=1 Tax=Chelatococcus asaccharovorans TaxID=28210 RepID=UPI00224C6E75|nr:hypothetical protein [Chelatococcus asaccharovorans]CAH1667313.1 conserved exported hypothetical protein [Chelatococcus asaccharovorans]CAH1681042.1 conserved exported hypothetical protein [Chelatococcus asaccharovorans]